MKYLNPLAFKLDIAQSIYLNRAHDIFNVIVSSAGKTNTLSSMANRRRQLTLSS